MRLRPATEADRESVLALGVAEEAAWFGEAESSAAEVAEWIDEEGGVGGGAVVVDAAGTIRGFASAGGRDGLLLADPTATGAITGLLLPWLLERRERLVLLTLASDAARVAAFERHGLRHESSSFTLARPGDPLPAPQFPDGIEIAPYRLGEDDEAVHRLIFVDAAWASVPGHTHRDLDAWRTNISPCTSCFVARRDDRYVGWVAGRLQANGRGFIASLAVATGARGRGLGRALLLHAFADLQAAGATDFGLGVEAANESALGLYRSVGLAVEREWRVYTHDRGGS